MAAVKQFKLKELKLLNSLKDVWWTDWSLSYPMRKAKSQKKSTGSWISNVSND